MYFIYFLRSESDPDKTYIGYTTNLVKRLKEHNSAEVGHTVKFRPWKVDTFFMAETLSAAIAAEKYFKNSSGQEKFKKYSGHNNPIEAFFSDQKIGRSFGRSTFKVIGNQVVVVSDK